MIETTLLFSYYLDWNEKGTLSVGLLVAALLFGVTKRAVSRIVILVSLTSPLCFSLSSLFFSLLPPTVGVHGV
jgi:hypothetical protein